MANINRLKVVLVQPRGRLTEMSKEYKKQLDRWEKNKATMVDAFKVLGYGEE